MSFRSKQKNLGPYPCLNEACARRFSTQKGVACHLNHPQSTCRTWFLGLSTANDAPEEHSDAAESYHDINDPLDPSNEDQADEDQSDLYCVEDFPNAGKTFGEGVNNYDYISLEHPQASERAQNPYYPFSCSTDWEVGCWLSRLNIPMYAMNEFFKLQYVNHIPSISTKA